MSGPSRRPDVLPAREPASLQAAIDAIRSGGIVGVPTETLYGMAVLPQAQPLARLLAAKRRRREKGIALLVDSMAQAGSLAVLDVRARRLAERLWPGALTLVVPPRPGLDLPDSLTGATGMVGVRLPDHDVPRAIAAAIGPIAVSSANVSGAPDAATVDELIDAVGDSLALVLDDGPVRGGVASTVVALAPGEPPRILRRGAIDPARVLAELE